MGYEYGWVSFVPKMLRRLQFMGNVLCILRSFTMWDGKLSAVPALDLALCGIGHLGFVCVVRDFIRLYSVI